MTIIGSNAHTGRGVRMAAMRHLEAPPAQGSNAPTRPRRFRVRSNHVSALLIDGSPEASQGGTHWLQPASYRPVDPIPPGTYLVHLGGRWATLAASDFEAIFEPMVRELPIFDDGEVH